MSPAPRDFTRADLYPLSPKQMHDAVRNGRKGTAMQPFATLLTAAEIDAVIAFVREEFMVRRAKNSNYHLPENGWENLNRHRAAFPFALGELSLNTPVEQLNDTQKAGRALYLSACVGCHERGHQPEDGQEGVHWEPRPLSYPRNGISPATVFDAITSASSYGIHERPVELGHGDPQLQRGEALFAANCAFCHARDASGRNWIGQFLEPHAADLATDPNIVATAASDLRERIKDGVAGSAMPAWKYVLSDSEIDSIVAYLQAVQTARY